MIYAPQDVNAGNPPRLVHYMEGSTLVLPIAVDTNLDTLVSVGTGGSRPLWIGTIGSLGSDFDDAGGIDLDVSTNTAFGALLPAGQTQSSFYTLNQQTGAVTLIGPIGNGLLISAMAVEPQLRPVPEPATGLLLVAALGVLVALGTANKRRRQL